MRILHIITDTDRRGAQVFAGDLGDALGRRNHVVHTVALAPGSRRPPLDVPVLGNHRRGLTTLRALRTAMDQYDVTVAHGSSTLLACAIAGAGPGRRFVYRQISDSRFWAPTLLRRVRVMAYMRAPDRIVALSSSARDTLVDYLRVKPGRVDVVPNGVPKRTFATPTPDERRRSQVHLGLPDGVPMVLYIGALVPEKGADVAVHALRELPDIHLAIVGGGPEREHLEHLAAETAPGRVHFLGELADTVTAYWACDVVVLPSKGGDSMPATLIEAGLCGVPAVSTDVGAIDEIVLHERTGLITEIGSDTELAAALRRLVDDPKLRDRLGTAAQRHCSDHFEIDVVAAAWERTLCSAMGA